MSAYSYAFTDIDPEKSPFLQYKAETAPEIVEPDIDAQFSEDYEVPTDFRNEFLYYLKHDIFVQRQEKLGILHKLPELSHEHLTAIMTILKNNLTDALDMKTNSPAELDALVASTKENWQRILKIWNERKDSEIAAAMAEHMFSRLRSRSHQPHDHPVCSTDRWFTMYRVSIDKAERRLKSVWQ
jgi:hypothetical protein